MQLQGAAERHGSGQVGTGLHPPSFLALQSTEVDEETIEQACDIGGSNRGGDDEDNNARVVLGRVVPDIGKIEVTGHQTLLLPLSMARNFTVARMPQPDVS